MYWKTIEISWKTIGARKYFFQSAKWQFVPIVIGNRTGKRRPSEPFNTITCTNHRTHERSAGASAIINKKNPFNVISRAESAEIYIINWRDAFGGEGPERAVVCCSKGNSISGLINNALTIFRDRPRRWERRWIFNIETDIAKALPPYGN